MLKCEPINKSAAIKYVPFTKSPIVWRRAFGKKIITLKAH